MFTTLGPDTLKELRHAWLQEDRRAHVNAFFDMHDIGDTLMQAGFSDPVMDVEHITLTYKEVIPLMKELKAIGAHNVTLGRQRGLTGKTKMQKLFTAYENFRQDGVLPCTYEVVYGHAWKLNKSQTKNSNDHSRIPVSSILRAPYNND